MPHVGPLPKYPTPSRVPSTSSEQPNSGGHPEREELVPHSRECNRDCFRMESAPFSYAAGQPARPHLRGAIAAAPMPPVRRMYPGMPMF